MELKFNEDVKIPQKIEFNFEELKREVMTKSDHYKNMVYTDDTIKDAKADKAKLNKFVTDLEDKRKAVRKECLQPYESFEKQVKELVAIINEPVKLIDDQVKDYEEKLKTEKKEKIKEYWEGTDHPEWLTCKQIFDQRWLNTTFSLKKVQEAIDERLAEIKTHITTIGMLPDFAFEAMETYKRTLDINSAIAEGQRLADMQKRKVEAQERAEREAELAMQKAAAEKEELAEPETAPFVPSPEPEEQKPTPKKQWVKFAAYLTVQEANELAAFFKSKNIEFKKA